MKDKQTTHFWPLKCPPPGSSLWTQFTGRVCSRGNSNYYFMCSYYCPHIVINGEGAVTFNGISRPVKRGSMFTLWPGYDIRYCEKHDHPWTYLFFRLDGANAGDFLRNCGISPENPVIDTAYPDNTIACFEKLHEYCGRRKPGDEYKLVSTLLSLPQFCATSRIIRIKLPDLTEQADNLIESRLSTGININEICEILKVSRITLFREFKARTGMSPVRFLARKRLEKARELLLATNKNLAETATLSGFNSESYFCKVFKKSTGMTPEQYRAGDGNSS